MKNQNSKSSVDLINEHIVRLDTLVAEHDLDAGYKHFLEHVETITGKAKDLAIADVSVPQLAVGNLYVSLAKNVIQIQNVMLSTYVNFMYLKRYMKDNGITSLVISEHITLSLDNFDENDIVQDCKRYIDTLDPNTLELDVIERNLVESSTDSKSEG